MHPESNSALKLGLDSSTTCKCKVGSAFSSFGSTRLKSISRGEVHVQWTKEIYKMILSVLNSMLCKFFGRLHFEIFLLFFPENRL